MRRRVKKQLSCNISQQNIELFALLHSFCTLYSDSPNYYWSSRGCTLVNETSDYIVCKCSHLTNFAILFDVEQLSYNPKSLEIISKIGCVISIVALLITIILYLVFRYNKIFFLSFNCRRWIYPFINRVCLAL